MLMPNVTAGTDPEGGAGQLIRSRMTRGIKRDDDNAVNGGKCAGGQHFPLLLLLLLAAEDAQVELLEVDARLEIDGGNLSFPRHIEMVLFGATSRRGIEV